MNSTLKLKSEESSGQLQLVEREDMEDVSIDVEKLILQGIGASDVKKLRNAGIFTCNVLMNLTGIKGLSEAKFDKMREAAEKLVVSDAPLKPKLFDKDEQLKEVIKRIAGHKAIDSDQAKEVIITELEDKVVELLRALIIQTDEIIDLEKKTKKSMDERKRHKKIITALKDLKEKNTYLKKDISTLEQENTALEEENTALKEENNSAKRDISTLKQENTALKEENNSAKRDNTYLKEQVEGLIEVIPLQERKDKIPTILYVQKYLKK